jgi:hypothetical protein
VASLWRYVLAVLGLLAVLAGILTAVYLHGEGPGGPNLASTRKTDGGLFVATLVPASGAVRQGELQSWMLTLKTPSGAPVENAAIDISGGMPQHDHGLPTSPQVADYLGQGRYRIDGVKFTMAGWWQLHLAISAAAGSDTVVFNIVL